MNTAKNREIKGIVFSNVVLPQKFQFYHSKQEKNGKIGEGLKIFSECIILYLKKIRGSSHSENLAELRFAPTDHEVVLVVCHRQPFIQSHCFEFCLFRW